jgi:hypothetical protein
MPSSSFSKAISSLIVAVIICVIVGVYVYYHNSASVSHASPPITTTTESTSTTSVNLPNLPAGWTAYYNPTDHISFGYPSTWTGGSDTLHVHYSSPSQKGFFDLLYNTETSDLDFEVNQEIHAPTHSVGSNPTVTKMTIDGHDARLVVPSSDGTATDRIFLYVLCGGDCQSSFMFDADKEDAMRIIQTMKFTQ